MAQPGITEEQYRAAFEQLCEDNKPDAINATMLQKVTGGRYGRAADALERLMSSWRQAQQAQQLIPVQPVWYRDFVTAGLENHRAMLEGLWPQIGPHIEERILEATTRLEAERDQMKEKYQEDRAHIELLENQVEELEQQLNEKLDTISQLQRRNDHLVLEGEKQERELERRQESLKAVKQDLFESRADLEEVRSERDRVLGENKNLRSDKEAMAAKLDIAVEEKTRTDAAWKQDSQRLQVLEQKLDEAREVERKASLENQSLKTRCDEVAKRVTELNTANAEQAQDNRLLVKQVTGLEKDLEASRKQQAELSEDLEAIKEQQKEWQKKQEARGKASKDKNGGTGNALQ